MELGPISLKEANEFVARNHRHHNPVAGHKFSVAAKKDGKIVGVAIVGRPVARGLDNVRTLEVTRLCTDRTRNACSFLYSKCAKIAKDMGYSKIVTYILERDPGISLLASGWTLEEAGVGGDSWDTPSRRRELIEGQLSFFPQKEKFPTGKKKDMQNYCPQGAYHRILLASGNVYNYIMGNEGEVY